MQTEKPIESLYMHELFGIVRDMGERKKERERERERKTSNFFVLPMVFYEQTKLLLLEKLCHSCSKRLLNNDVKTAAAKSIKST